MRVVVTGAAGMIGSQPRARAERDRHRRHHRRRRPDRRRQVPQPRSARRSADYFDRREFYARFARGELGRIDAVFHEGACSDTMEHDGRLMLDTQLPLLEGRCSTPARRRASRLLYASSAATYGGSATRSARSPSSSGRSTSTATRSCCSTTSCGACCRRRRRRSRAFATSTSTARASSTRAAWRRSRSTTSTSSASDGQGQAVRRVRRLRRRASRRATSSSSTTSSRSTSGSSQHPEASGIFNLGSGRAQPFNDVAVGGRQCGARRSAARRRCRWPRLVAAGTIEYIDFPDALVGKYQCFTAGRPRAPARASAATTRSPTSRRRRPLRRWLRPTPEPGSTPPADRPLPCGRRSERDRRARSLVAHQELSCSKDSSPRSLRCSPPPRSPRSTSTRPRQAELEAIKRHRPDDLGEDHRRAQEGAVQGLERPLHARQGRRRPQRRQVLGGRPDGQRQGPTGAPRRTSSPAKAPAQRRRPRARRRRTTPPATAAKKPRRAAAARSRPQGRGKAQRPQPPARRPRRTARPPAPSLRSSRRSAHLVDAAPSCRLTPSAISSRV